MENENGAVDTLLEVTLDVLDPNSVGGGDNSTALTARVPEAVGDCISLHSGTSSSSSSESEGSVLSAISQGNELESTSVDNTLIVSTFDVVLMETDPHNQVSASTPQSDG